MIFMTLASPFRRCLENNRAQHRDFHLVGRLGPADEFVAAVQGERAQNLGRELGFATMQIVFAQDESQRLKRKEVAAAGIAQDVPPPSRLFHPSPRRPVTEAPLPAFTAIPSPCPKRSRETRIAIAPGDNFRARPNLSAKLSSELRSSSVTQPARKIPTRSISFGNCGKMERSRSGVVSRKFEGGSFP